VTGAYFVYPIRADGLIDAAALTAQAAIEAAVQSLVDMSQRPVRREAKSHVSRDHWVSERVFNWCGIPTTHLGPRDAVDLHRFDTRSFSQWDRISCIFFDHHVKQERHSASDPGAL